LCSGRRVIYADDTNLLIDEDNKNELDRRLRNYQMAAGERDLNLQWGKTEIVSTK